MTDPQSEFSFDDDLPESIREALRSRFGASGVVPSATDEAILADARRQLSEARPMVGRRRSKIFRLVGLTSTLAAAAVALMVWVRPPGGNEESQRPLASVNTLKEDVDGNGRVDILDAFAVARQLQRGDSVVAVDLDGDGRTTQADVDALAQRAVMLSQG